MGKLSLKITIARSSKVTKQEFDTQMTVFDVCRQIREKVPDAVEPGDSVNDYGLLKLDDLDPRFGTWLEAARALEFYQLENNSVLDYKTKKRPLRVETLDMTIRTIIVDDSLNVKDLVKTVCARYGLNNPEEFSFIVKVCLSVCLFVYFFVYLFTSLFTCLFVYLFTSLFTCLFVYLFVYCSG